MVLWNKHKRRSRAPMSDRERGAMLIEKAVLVGLIAVVCVSSLTLLSHRIKGSICGNTTRNGLVLDNSGRSVGQYFESGANSGRCANVNYTPFVPGSVRFYW
jgi:Flp pilus assembly pilin Flp